MKHRHLLPDEIDQLLDGEAGFGVAVSRTVDAQVNGSNPGPAIFVALRGTRFANRRAASLGDTGPHVQHATSRRYPARGLNYGSDLRVRPLPRAKPRAGRPADVGVYLLEMQA